MIQNPEHTVATEQVFRGHIVGLRVDTVQLPGGRVSLREIVDHSGSVAVVPLDGQGNVLMVRQYRKPIEQELLEIPAGMLEPGEEPEAAARRELGGGGGIYRTPHGADGPVLHQSRVLR